MLALVLPVLALIPLVAHGVYTFVAHLRHTPRSRVTADRASPPIASPWVCAISGFDDKCAAGSGFRYGFFVSFSGGFLSSCLRSAWVCC